VAIFTLLFIFLETATEVIVFADVVVLTKFVVAVVLLADFLAKWLALGLVVVDFLLGALVSVLLIVFIYIDGIGN